MKLLGRLPGNDYDWAYATAVSYDGSVVVGTDRTFNGLRAYRWTEATGQVDLGTVGPPKVPNIPPFSEASDVSGAGDTVVGFIGATEDGGYKAYRWHVTDGLQVIGLPGWPSSPNPYGGAYHISGDGQIIYGRDQKTGAWIWTEPSGFALLPSAGANTDVFVHALSRDGSTLVGDLFFWNTPRPLINVTEAAIWRRTAAGYERFYVADALRHHGVDLQGWRLTQAFDVSADGRTLIGTGINPQGVEKSWYAVLDGVLTPEPASAVMAIAGICASVGVMRAQAATSRRLRRPLG